MHPAWWVVAAVLALGLVLGPMNNVCCFVGLKAEYKTIQAALDAAQPGSTIVVFSGIYLENLVIQKPVRLVSAEHTIFFPLPNHQPPLLQARQEDLPSIQIQASGVTLQGFTVRGGASSVSVQDQHHVWILDNQLLQSKRGITIERSQEIWVERNRIAADVGMSVQGSQHIRVTSNTFDVASAGMQMAGTRRALIKGNALRGYADGAITLDHSPQNALVNNRFESQGPGLLLLNSPRAAMRGNRLPAGPRSFWIEGDVLEDFLHDIDGSNTIGDLPLLYLNGLKNRALKPGLKAGFLALVNARNITVQGLQVSDLPGLLLVNAQGITVSDSAFQNTRAGINAFQSSEIAVSDVTVTGSLEDGMRFERCKDVQLERLTLSASGGNGVYAFAGENLSLRASRIASSKASAVWLEGLSLGAVSGNELSESGLYAVSLKGAREVSLQDNVLRASQTGLYLEAAHHNTIEGNSIQNNQFGISLKDSADNTITKNVLTWNLRGSFQGLLENNLIQDNVEQSSQKQEPPAQEEEKQEQTKN